MENTYLNKNAEALERQLLLHEGLHYADANITGQIESITYSNAIDAGVSGGLSGAGSVLYPGVPIAASFAIANSYIKACFMEICETVGLEYEKKTVKSIAGVIERKAYQKLAALLVAQTATIAIPGIGSASAAMLNYIMVYAGGAVTAGLLQELIKNGEIEKLIKFDKSKTTIYVQNTLSKMQTRRLFGEAKNKFLQENEMGSFSKSNTVPEQEGTDTEQED